MDKTLESSGQHDGLRTHDPEEVTFSHPNRVTTESNQGVHGGGPGWRTVRRVTSPVLPPVRAPLIMNNLRTPGDDIT
jgi:hypothetical protein